MGVTITQLADREDSRSDKPYCIAARSAGFYLHTNRDDDKMGPFIIFMYKLHNKFDVL